MGKFICLLTLFCASHAFAVDKEFIDAEIAKITRNSANVNVANKGEQGISSNSDVQDMKSGLDSQDKCKTSHSLKNVETGYDRGIDAAPQTKDQDNS